MAFEEKRKFPRVSFEWHSHVGEILRETSVEWPNGERVGVVDMSYSGAAIKMPSDQNLKKDHEFPLVIHFLEHTISVLARVAWFNEKVVGVSFLSVPDREIPKMKKLLDDKIIGSNTRMVANEFFAPNTEFDLWYHGPGETEIFFWLSDSESRRMKRAVVEFAGGYCALTEDMLELQAPGERVVTEIRMNPLVEAIYDPWGLRKKYVDRICDMVSQIEIQAPHLNDFIQRLGGLVYRKNLGG